MGRGGDAERVGMEDFEEAVRMETGGKWTGKGLAIGFQGDGNRVSETVVIKP